MTTMIEIMQSDREAAGDYLESIGQKGSAEVCRAGKGWKLTAQAFAEYRIKLQNE